MFDIAKLGVINHENKKNGNARLASTLYFHYAIYRKLRKTF